MLSAIVSALSRPRGDICRYDRSRERRQSYFSAPLRRPPLLRVYCTLNAQAGSQDDTPTSKSFVKVLMNFAEAHAQLTMAHKVNHAGLEMPSLGNKTQTTDNDKSSIEKSESSDEDSVESGPGDEQKPEKRAVTGWRWFLVCAGLYCAIFLYGLDNTVAADIQSAVIDAFGEVGQLAWIGTGFPLGSTATILTFAKAYGIFNVKWLHLGSIAIFAIGSAVCGSAPSMDALIVGRVIAGTGGAGLYLGMLNLITINTTEKERPTYMGGTAVIWGIGTVLGPIIGGAFADSGATWRWAFYINLVILAALLPALLCIPSFNPRPGVSIHEKLRDVDWVGAVLNAGLYTSFVLVLTFGGIAWPWNDGRTIALWAACGIVLLTFMAQQYFCVFTTPERRIFPVHFIASRTLVLLHIGTACSSTGMFLGIYYIPLVFQFSRGDNGIESAVRLLPFIFLLCSSVMGFGHLFRFYSRYSAYYIVGGAILTLGSALMFTTRTGTSTGAIYAFEALMGLGIGINAQLSYSVAPVKVPPKDIAAAIGFMNVAQIGASVLALTIAGAIFQNVTFSRLGSILEPAGFTAQQIHAAISGSQDRTFNSLPSGVREHAADIIVRSVSDLYAMVIAAGALCLVSGLLMKKEKLM